ncbi:Trimethylamine corrinoid protein 1 [Candidatus Desulfarcum epimagneticum]|uniref:Trimethylamine corrinoid protein 1 n=1 Tax=uncultured Desulfobacteraceae bacterium TaxID=218296 RepID=A0A484HI62_9BACT|nr:Trimethylamine corrinoid protein 1 [uncultured Desulfobacteraceae bacterium]
MEQQADILKHILSNVIQGRVSQEDEGVDEGLVGQPAVTERIRHAVELGIPPREIIIKALSPAMERVGENFENGEYLIPDMLAAAECVEKAMDILKPHLSPADIKEKGKFVLATVQGDLHDIGKNIAGLMIKSEGYQVIDLGHDVVSDAIIQKIKETGAAFVGLSALLTTTMRAMAEVVEKISDAGIRDQVTIFIGGAPTSQEFADQIGADVYCRDAFHAIQKLREFE